MDLEIIKSNINFYFLRQIFFALEIKFPDQLKLIKNFKIA